VDPGIILHPREMMRVIEADNLPEIGVEAAVILAQPSLMIDPEFKDRRVVNRYSPGPIAGPKLRNQMLHNPAMADDQHCFAIGMGR
jgi:hypothetical protein